MCTKVSGQEPEGQTVSGERLVVAWRPQAGRIAAGQGPYASAGKGHAAPQKGYEADHRASCKFPTSGRRPLTSSTFLFPSTNIVPFMPNLLGDFASRFHY
jgi:hypothetical protein